MPSITMSGFNTPTSEDLEKMIGVELVNGDRVYLDDTQHFCLMYGKVEKVGILEKSGQLVKELRVDKIIGFIFP